MPSRKKPIVKVGVVVLNYNNADEVIKYLRGVDSNNEVGVIQIVDNCSTDDSYARISSFCNSSMRKDILLSKSVENGGYAKGNNFGVRTLCDSFRCEYLLISNPDVIYDKKTVASLVDYLDENHNYAAASPVMVNVKDQMCLSGWKLPTKVDLHLYNLKHVIPMLPDPCAYPKRLYRGEKPFDTEALPGSLFMIRTDVFQAIGGFDEDTFLYGEENLLFAKVKTAGMKCAVLPSARYVHAHGTTIKKEIGSIRRRYELLLESNVIYCRKVLHTSDAFIKLFKALFTFSVDVFAFEMSIRNLFLKRG